MGKNLLDLATISTGFLMAVLSHIFLRPVFRNVFGESDHKPLGNSNRIFISVAGIITIGAVNLIITSSLKTTVIIVVVPPFLWILIYLLKERLRKKHRSIIIREFPLLLDFLVLQIESGHSIQQALRSASGLFVDGSPLNSGLRDVDDSLQIGCRIVQALEKFSQWLDTPGAVAPILAISQAIQHGTPLGKILREQSKRMRENLILEGEQFANKVSVKILIPLLFFIFPASFLVIFSPVIVTLSERFP